MRLSLQLRMIVWTSIAVVLTGLCALYFLLQPPRPIAMKFAEAEAANGDRKPSSVVTPLMGSDEPAKIQLQAAELDLECNETKHSYDGSVAQVRISGSTCGPSKAAIQSTEIINEANGFSATVFHPSETGFTTDYITLSMGVNRIRILHELVQGEREEREYFIDRGPNL